MDNPGIYALANLAITGALSLFMGTELQAMADRVYLDAAVAEVVGDLRYARSMAVREGFTVQVAVNADQPGITLFRSGELAKPLAPGRDLQKRGESCADVRPSSSSCASIRLVGQ